MHKTSSNQSDSSGNQKIRLYDYDEARSELLIRGGKKVMARENFIFCRIFSTNRNGEPFIFPKLNLGFSTAAIEIS